MYAEMFAFYVIRELCKIFCMTDIQAYTNLVRHVRFVRHSDLSDGDCCRDDIFRLEKIVKKRKAAKATFPFGAGSRGRTDTVSLPPDFESGTSANSIIPANMTLVL